MSTPGILAVASLSWILSGALFASPASAQSGVVRAGQTVYGRLESTDPVLEDASFYDEWTYRGSQGERIRVDLKSTDFDAYLSLGTRVNGEFVSLADNDDGDDELDSRIEITLPATGEYVIRANSLFADATGAYSLLVASLGQATAAASAAAGAISTNQTVVGSLAAGRGELGDNWAYSARQGERLSISLSSDDFDPVLVIQRRDGAALVDLAEDDDGGEGTDALLVFTFPAAGEYVISVKPYGGTGSGSYTLTTSAR